MLSHSRPVGIMVYNRANILGIPWETIIKQYRKERAALKCDHLNGYAEDFLGYLNENDLFFSDSALQDHAAVSDVLFGFVSLTGLIDETLMKYPGKVTTAQILTAIEAFTDALYDQLTKIDMPPYPPNHKTDVYKRYVGSIEVIIDEVFQQTPLRPQLRKKLRRVGLYFLLVGPPTGDQWTGIVIAGFGERDVFPALHATRVTNIVLDRACYTITKISQVTLDDSALIYAFAQLDVVQGFMDGITTEMTDELRDAIRGYLDTLGERLIKKLPRMKASKRQEVLQELEDAKKEIQSRFSDELREYCTQNNSDPIVQTVALLPKEELATMAETLVNLTSFKRRVTLDTESVGGPVDVAVITKGDGFVWIKRKHYFSPELNPHYFKRHI